MSIVDAGELDGVVEPILERARIPGAAIAVVLGQASVLARGYGYRDLEAKLRVTPETSYPIASTSKALNATLLGMLVDEKRVAWDTPVRTYLPGFRLKDAVASSEVTLRDLISMRTGLPRHDWAWIENPSSRAELVERLQHLQPSMGFRERFQYNNLTVTAGGYIAEKITGQRWEDLAQERILTPLGMDSTGFARPTTREVTLSYHENGSRELRRSDQLATEVTAPAGGAIYSTVLDMARWIAFNLAEGTVQGRQLLQLKTLQEIHSPQVAARGDPSAPTPNAVYGMGWFLDTYNGRPRISHGGYLHDVNSEVMLFPQEGLGIVAFINFGPPGLARLLCQYAFDLIHHTPPEQTAEEKLAAYEGKIEDNRKRIAAVRRVEHTAPSHALGEYVGTYTHPGYGTLGVERQCDGLALRRNRMVLPLEHWHYDTWVAQDSDLFFIHQPHAFDRGSRLTFGTGVDGEIATLSVQWEPAVEPICFISNPSSRNETLCSQHRD